MARIVRDNNVISFFHVNQNDFNKYCLLLLLLILFYSIIFVKSFVSRESFEKKKAFLKFLYEYFGNNLPDLTIPTAKTKTKIQLSYFGKLFLTKQTNLFNESDLKLQ